MSSSSRQTSLPTFGCRRPAKIDGTSWATATPTLLVAALFLDALALTLPGVDAAELFNVRGVNGPPCPARFSDTRGEQRALLGRTKSSACETPILGDAALFLEPCTLAFRGVAEEILFSARGVIGPPFPRHLAAIRFDRRFSLSNVPSIANNDPAHAQITKRCYSDLHNILWNQNGYK